MVGYEKWRLIFRNSFSLGIIFEIRGEDRFISCTKEYAVSKPEGGGQITARALSKWSGRLATTAC